MCNGNHPEQISVLFIVATLITEVLFILLCNELNRQGREMDTSVLDDNWGTQHHCIFIVATLVTDVLFEQFLICTAV